PHSRTVVPEAARGSGRPRPQRGTCRPERYDQNTEIVRNRVSVPGGKALRSYSCWRFRGFWSIARCSRFGLICCYAVKGVEWDFQGGEKGSSWPPQWQPWRSAWLPFSYSWRRVRSPLPRPPYSPDSARLPSG